MVSQWLGIIHVTSHHLTQDGPRALDSKPHHVDINELNKIQDESTTTDQNYFILDKFFITEPFYHYNIFADVFA